MSEVNLLAKLPRSQRNIRKRASAKTPEHTRLASQFGELYFDGPREYGYGGYRYDGRWMPVAQDMVRHFGLRRGMRVLDIGCAKGFLVKDLMAACPGLEAFGLDISHYALMHCEPEVIGRLHLGTQESLPFPNASFDAVVSINTLHNLDRGGCIRALQEINRVCRLPNKSFVQVDAYRNQTEKDLFESWCLTALTYLTPKEWVHLYEAAGYRGDYFWTVLELDEQAS